MFYNILVYKEGFLNNNDFIRAYYFLSFFMKCSPFWEVFDKWLLVATKFVACYYICVNATDITKDIFTPMLTISLIVLWFWDNILWWWGAKCFTYCNRGLYSPTYQEAAWLTENLFEPHGGWMDKT